MAITGRAAHQVFYTDLNTFDLLIGQGTTTSILQFVFGQKKISVAILDTKEGFEDNKTDFFFYQSRRIRIPVGLGHGLVKNSKFIFILFLGQISRKILLMLVEK